MDPVYRVRPWAGGWGVYRDDELATVEPLRTSGDAVSHAKELARKNAGGAQICVYGPSGALMSEFFYQAEERSALDRDAMDASFAASRPVTSKRARPPR